MPSPRKIRKDLETFFAPPLIICNTAADDHNNIIIRQQYFFLRSVFFLFSFDPTHTRHREIGDPEQRLRSKSIMIDSLAYYDGPCLMGRTYTPTYVGTYLYRVIHRV